MPRPFSLRSLPAYGTVFFFYLISYVLIVVVPLHARRAGIGEADIGTVMGLAGLASMLARPLVGYTVGRWGAGRVISATLLVYAVSLAAYTSTSLPVLGALRLLHGLSSAALSTAVALTLMAALPPAARGVGMSYYSLATTVPSIGTALAVQLYQTVSFPLLVAGLVMVGVFNYLLSVPFVRIAGKPVAAPVVAAGGQRSAWQLSAASVVICFLNTAFGTTLTFLALSCGSPSDATVLLLLQSLTLVASRFLSRRLIPSDGRAPTILVAVMMLLAACGMGLIGGADQPGLRAAGAVCNGVAFGVTFPALLTFCSFVGPRRRGPVVGLFISAGDLGFALGAAVMGWLAQGFGFPTMYAASALLCLLGGSLFLTIPKG